MPATPPSRDPLPLVRTRVDGDRCGHARQALEMLAVGDPLVLRREPANPDDRRAIEVPNLDERGLGLVARIGHPAVARMVDAGERMRAVVAGLDPDLLDIRPTAEWLHG